MIQVLPGVVKFRLAMVRRASGEAVSSGVGFLQLDKHGKIATDFLFMDV